MDNLSLKYRPQTFETVVGQHETLVGLQNYLVHATNPQSLLFSGPRGTGKTTTARLVVKTLNCLEAENKPCGECITCQAVAAGSFVDLLELDGATNRGIDAIRQVIERVYHSPIHKHKIIIVDEAHMLTREASNSLLKVLEEPPPGVVFILCTTEEHRILPTIKSRLKIYRFRLIESALVKDHLTVICTQEGLTISSDILDFIVAEGAGSMRDSIRTLDQVRELGDTVTMEQVLENIGLVSLEKVSEFIGKLIDKDLVGVFQVIEELSRTSEIPLFYQQLMDYLQQLFYVVLGVDVGFNLPLSAVNQGKLIDSDWVLRVIQNLVYWNKSLRPINRLGLEGAVVQSLTREVTPTTVDSGPQSTTNFIADRLSKQKGNNKTETDLKAQF